MNKNTYFLSIILISCMLFPSCDGINGAYPYSDSMIYTNSFESKADIKKWEGDMSLITEAPKGGGSSSVYVAGGCVHPHTAYEFNSPGSGALSLQAWAKTMSEIGGGVTLLNTRTGEHIFVSVQDEEWVKLRSEKTLAVLKGDKLQLTMSAGGFVPSNMLITLVQVEAHF